jgi:indolepyruvate ferredoxin oxidoreductase, alpha subunit
MSVLLQQNQAVPILLLGNEAIARGALEAGISVASGYPGTPSSEIIESLSQLAVERNLYVEWSSNEKIALEVAAAASFAQLRALCAMKQNGVNVASDFLLHLAGSGTRGGLVLVSAEDPGAISSVNEGESRYFAKMIEFPLLEPGDFQEAKDMTKWAFELSEELRSLVMIRSVTRLSHASGNVRLGSLPDNRPRAEFRYGGFILDPLEGVITSAPVVYKHSQQQLKLSKAAELFESSPFNTYTGPEKPELLIITCSTCSLYSREAIHVLGLEDRVGLLKLGTTWPLPSKLVTKTLAKAERILFIEEVAPFLEENVKVLAAEKASDIGIKTFHGKNDGSIPRVGELNPDIVITALCRILGLKYEAMDPAYEKKAQEMFFARAPNRDLTFCPGCPHRASFWSIHNALQRDNRKGFVCGDIGCYTLALLPCGYSTVKTLHAMGSGTGIASGFGKLGQFGLEQPVLAVCGDSTFFASIVPALTNAVHHRSNITLVILDNSGTAMTGFQPHPGLSVNAMGSQVPKVDILKICEAIGAKVELKDPFEIEETRKTLNRLMEDPDGVKVLVLRQICALSPEKRARKSFEMRIDEDRCLGESCGCNRLCTRIFQCPGLVWNKEKGKACIDEVICAGCGVCASICPQRAIIREEAA